MHRSRKSGSRNSVYRPPFSRTSSSDASRMPVWRGKLSVSDRARSAFSALMEVSLIVRLFFQLPSFGCVKSSRPSMANRTSSWFHSSTSTAILRSLMLIMSSSQDSRRPGLEDEMRRHSFVGTSFASRFMWFRCSSIFSCDCLSSSLPSRWAGVTLYRRASSSGYLVTRCTGTWNERVEIHSPQHGILHLRDAQKDAQQLLLLLEVREQQAGGALPHTVALKRVQHWGRLEEDLTNAHREQIVVALLVRDVQRIAHPLRQELVVLQQFFHVQKDCRELLLVEQAGDQHRLIELLQSRPYFSSVSTISVMISFRSARFLPHLRQTSGAYMTPDSVTCVSTGPSQSSHSALVVVLVVVVLIGFCHRLRDVLLVSDPTPESFRSISADALLLRPLLSVPADRDVSSLESLIPDRCDSLLLMSDIWRWWCRSSVIGSASSSSRMMSPAAPNWNPYDPSSCTMPRSFASTRYDKMSYLEAPSKIDRALRCFSKSTSSIGGAVSGSGGGMSLISS
uniref:Uncharacterized protein n=1 Tax=Anopheles merus TaxID=30066 RepID=A0A182UR82_ANOME